MKTYTIYKLSNTVNDKCYIGIDSGVGRISRIESHRLEAHNPKQKPYWFRISVAIREIGWEYFLGEILYQSTDKNHCLEMEKHFIKEYDSFNNGYNMTLGGEGAFGVKQSQEHIKKRVSKMVATKTSNPKQILSKKKIPNCYQSKTVDGWLLTPPIGDLIITGNLAKVCRQYNISRSAMMGVANGICNHHKQWKCAKILIKKN